MGGLFGRKMAASYFKILRFQLQPFESVILLPADLTRQYFLIAANATSGASFEVLLYENATLNYKSAPDALTLFLNGYYEPYLVPNNPVSVGNPNATGVASGFCYYV